MRKTVWYWDDEKNMPTPAVLEKPTMKKYKEIFPEKKNFWSIISKAWMKSNRREKCDKA